MDYSLEGLITSSETPGSIDVLNSYGQIIPEDQFPIFNPILKTIELLEPAPSVVNFTLNLMSTFAPERSQKYTYLSLVLSKTRAGR